MHAGQVLPDHPNGIHGGATIQPVFLNASGDGKGQGVVEDLVGRDAELEGIAIGPLGDGELLLGRSGHPVLIDRADHHSGAVAAGQLQNLEEALVTVFVVGGVENAFPPSHLQARLHLLPLGGIEHQGQVDVGDQTAHQLVHVPFAIATDVVDVHVEHVGVFLHLAAGHRHQPVPVFLRQQFAHLATATGIEPLTNDQERIVLVVWRDAIDR